MCGIAGLIHRGKSSNVGLELQGMLQALKHRGEDSTGYALYGDTDGKNFIMRFKVGENVGEGSTSVVEDVSVYDERKKIVDQTITELGAKILKEERRLPYSLRYEIEYKVSGEAFLCEPSSFVYKIQNIIKKNTKIKPKLSTSGGTSDARFIRKISPCLEFGLVGKTMHKIDEAVSLKDLKNLTKIYAEILEEYFK